MTIVLWVFGKVSMAHEDKGRVRDITGNMVHRTETAALEFCSDAMDWA